MLSHDNYVFTVNSTVTEFIMAYEGHGIKLVSYLPLSHSASQIIDIFGCIVKGAHVHFADATALQGSLVNYLKEVRPTFFFSVPRVWEKIEEQMR